MFINLQSKDLTTINEANMYKSIINLVYVFNVIITGTTGDVCVSTKLSRCCAGVASSNFDCVSSTKLTVSDKEVTANVYRSQGGEK